MNLGDRKKDFDSIKLSNRHTQSWMHPSDQSWTLCEHLAAELLASSELHTVPAGPNVHLWVPLSHAGVQSIHALLGSSHAISHLSLVNNDTLLSIHTYYAY